MPTISAFRYETIVRQISNETCQMSNDQQLANECQIDGSYQPDVRYEIWNEMQWISDERSQANIRCKSDAKCMSGCQTNVQLASRCQQNVRLQMTSGSQRPNRCQRTTDVKFQLMSDGCQIRWIKYCRKNVRWRLNGSFQTNFRWMTKYSCQTDASRVQMDFSWQRANEGCYRMDIK